MWLFKAQNNAILACLDPDLRVRIRIFDYIYIRYSTTMPPITVPNPNVMRYGSGTVPKKYRVNVFK
jgi:hypothetical protein